MSLTRYLGNCPRNVSKDAKYSIRVRDGRLVVALVYNSDTGERWLATTEEHPDLAGLVQAVKIELSGRPDGPFYINEYGQVIVPDSKTDDYFLAGEYFAPLRFEFEGRVLQGDGVDLEGRGLREGEPWVGPHPGIPYRLKAGGKDIYYKMRPRPNVEKKVTLSDSTGAQAAERIASRFRKYKGHEGGRFYINEFRCLFAPVSTDDEYVFMGRLGKSEPWFPKPHS